MVTRDIQHELAREVVREIAVPPPLEGGGGSTVLTPTRSWDFTQSVLGSEFIFSRASAAGHFNSSGIWEVEPSNTARIDHDPLSLVARGLLVEESRTNSLRHSRVPASQTISLNPGTYTLWVRGTGSCTVSAGTALGSGFGTANEANFVVFAITTAGTLTFTVTGSLERFQCELGAFPTSFIATMTGTATRSADICSLDMAAFLNTQEGTMILECGVGQSGSVALGMDNGSGGAAYRAYITCNPNSRQYVVSFSGVSQASLTYAAPLAAGAVLRMAITYSTTGYSFVVNGENIGFNAAASDGLYVTTARIGCRFQPTAVNFLNGHIRTLSYYAKALDTTQLMQLTA